MKVLFYHGLPFSLVHGGAQTQIEQTKCGLESVGVDGEWLRFWDGSQAGDIIHAFAPVERTFIQEARSKGIPVVLTSLLTAECNWPKHRLKWKHRKLKIMEKLPGFSGIYGALSWRNCHSASINIVGLECEKRVLSDVYGVPEDKIAVVPLGLSETYLKSEPATREGDCLICVGTITERKQSVKLAEMAREAEVPVLFVGKPYREDDPYWRVFKSLIDDRWVNHHSHVSSEEGMIELYRRARGFVIFSAIENWCLAAHEAAACGLPLLLPSLNWSRERFPEASFFPGSGQAEALRNFWNGAKKLPTVPRNRVPGWDESARQLSAIYREILGGPKASFGS